jgi:hypothetical protein
VDIPTCLAIGALVVAMVCAVFTAFNAARVRGSYRLQRSIDARAREFREVAWQGGLQRRSPSADWEFTLSNLGLTAAVNVTLVVEVIPTELFTFATIGPGETRSIPVGGGQQWDEANRHVVPVRPAFRVYWFSPEGHPDEQNNPGIQIFS